MKIKVIDISTHQKQIDWNKVKADGVQGVIIRAGYGRELNQKDAKFEEHYAGAKSVGLPVGAYHYSHATSPEEARVEANTMLKWIQGKQFELPIYYDAEEAGITTDCCIAYCEVLENADYFVGVYASKNWFANILNYDRLKRFTLWCAQYYTECTLGRPIQAWQYTSQGRVNGYNGNIDMNEFYEDFPSIIKNAGLNGFPKGGKPITPQNKPQHLKGTVICSALNMRTKPVNGNVIRVLPRGNYFTVLSAKDGWFKINHAGTEGYVAVDDNYVKVEDLNNNNKVIYYGTPITGNQKPAQDLTAIAQAVYRGDYGNNPQRAERLRAEGYDPDVVQDKVDELYYS